MKGLSRPARRRNSCRGHLPSGLPPRKPPLQARYETGNPAPKKEHDADEDNPFDSEPVHRITADPVPQTRIGECAPYGAPEISYSTDEHHHESIPRPEPLQFRGIYIAVKIGEEQPGYAGYCRGEYIRNV